MMSGVSVSLLMMTLDHPWRRRREVMLVCAPECHSICGPLQEPAHAREDVMLRWLFGLLALASTPVLAQEVPQIPYESVPNLLKLPTDMYLGEVAGVAVNSK